MSQTCLSLTENSTFSSYSCRYTELESLGLNLHHLLPRPPCLGPHPCLLWLVAPVLPQEGEECGCCCQVKDQPTGHTKLAAATRSCQGGYRLQAGRWYPIHTSINLFSCCKVPLSSLQKRRRRKRISLNQSKAWWESFQQLTVERFLNWIQCIYRHLHHQVTTWPTCSANWREGQWRPSLTTEVFGGSHFSAISLQR